MLIQTITIPIYNQKINLISGDREECIDYLNDLYTTGGNLNINWLEKTRAATYNINDDIWIYIDLYDVSIPILVHELSHATFDVMNFIGLELSDQEAFCYLQEFLLEETLKYLPFKIIPIDVDEIYEEI